MIEILVKPVPLDNDVAVIKILQLMGQLSVGDIKYIVNVASEVYQSVAEKETNDSCNA
jgi:hypothetical protein